MLARKAPRFSVLLNKLAVLYHTGIFTSRQENDLMWNQDNYIYVFESCFYGDSFAYACLRSWCWICCFLTSLESLITELGVYVCVFVSQNELRPAYEDFLLKKQEKAKKKKKEEVNCTLMYKTIRFLCFDQWFHNLMNIFCCLWLLNNYF